MEAFLTPRVLCRKTAGSAVVELSKPTTHILGGAPHTLDKLRLCQEEDKVCKKQNTLVMNDTKIYWHTQLILLTKV